MVARAWPTEAQVREGGCERFSRDGEAVVIDLTTQRLNGEGNVAGKVRHRCVSWLGRYEAVTVADLGLAEVVCEGGYGGRGTELRGTSRTPSPGTHHATAA
ncbi:Ribosomal protein S18 acetylase RimI [Sesbania bispinosa]|nr:Ribosomal protein S18 acetylase RimI [Sesbania bispinosa]